MKNVDLEADRNVSLQYIVLMSNFVFAFIAVVDGNLIFVKVAQTTRSLMITSPNKFSFLPD